MLRYKICELEEEIAGLKAHYFAVFKDIQKKQKEACNVVQAELDELEVEKDEAHGSLP